MDLPEDEITDRKNFPQNLAGYCYQLKLLLLFLWRGLDKEGRERKYTYKIGTEFKPAEKFDDIVFFDQTEPGQQGHVICLQAKHTRTEGAELQYEHFVSDDNKAAICNLRKYFISFRKILQQKNFFPNEYILCNNYIMPDSKMVENVKNSEDLICFISVNSNTDCSNIVADVFSDSFQKWECHKIDEISDKVENMLLGLSNLHILGHELIDSIIDCEKKGLKHVNFDLKNYWISMYYFALFKDNVIATKDVVIFKKEFIDPKQHDSQICSKVDPKEQIKEDSKKNLKFDNVRNFFFEEYSKKADWNFVQNIRFNGVFISILEQKIHDPQINQNAVPADAEKEFAKALVYHALNPFDTTINPIILQNIKVLKKVVRCIKQYTFSDGFLDIVRPQNILTQIIIEKYKLSHTFKKETVNILFEKESEDSENSPDKELDGPNLAKKLAKLFFCKKKISSSVWHKCSKYLKVIDNGMKLVFDFCADEKVNETSEDVQTFYNEFLTYYAIERLKHLEIKFTNRQVDELINDVINVFLNPNRKLDFKKYEAEGTFGELEMLLEELFDLNGQNNDMQLKETFFEKSFPLSKNAKKFKDKLEEIKNNLQRNSLINYKIKIKTWDDLLLEEKAWVTEKIKLLAKEIKDLLENRQEEQPFFIYDKEKCKRNGTQGLLKALFGEHFTRRKYAAKKSGSIEDHLILTRDFFEKITASEKVQIFKAQFNNFDMNKFCGTLVIKSLFNKAKQDDEESQNLRRLLTKEIVDLIQNKKNKNDKLIVYNKFKFQNNGTTGFLEHLIGPVFEEKDNVLTFNLQKKQDLFVKILQQAYSDEIIQKFKDRKILFAKIPHNIGEIAEKLGTSINAMNPRCNVVKYSGISRNTMKELSESVFVSTNDPNKIKFSSYFFEREIWSKEVQEFQQILEGTLSVKTIKEMEEKQFIFNITQDAAGEKFTNSIEIATVMAKKILELLGKNQEQKVLTFNMVYCDSYRTNTIDEKSGKNLSTTSTRLKQKVSKDDKLGTPSCIITSIINCVFEASETLKMKKMKKVFFKYGKWSKNIETFREKLRNQLKNSDLSPLKNLIIEIENFPFCCDSLIEEGDIYSQLIEFKKKLLVITTPNEEKLSDMISKEIDDELYLTNDDSAAKVLLVKVINWVKGKEERLLTKNEMKAFIDEIKGKLSSMLAAGFSFRGKLRQYGMSFNNIKINAVIKEFLQSDGKILILESNFTQLTAVKVDKVLLNEPKCRGVNSVIFHDLSSLSSLENFEIKNDKFLGIISFAFNSKETSNLLVVVDDSSESSTTTIMRSFSLLNNLLNPALQIQNKQLIFITCNSSQFINFFEFDSFFKDIDIKTHVDHIYFNELTEDSQASVIRQDGIFKGLKICKSSKSKQCDPDIYVERLVGPINIDDRFFQTCYELNENNLNLFKHIFVFDGINKLSLKKMLEPYGIESNHTDPLTYLNTKELKTPYVCESQINYETFVQLSLQHTVHHILIKAETSEIHSNFMHKAYVSEDYFLHYISKSRIVYINDLAGMGKSTILSSFEQKIKKNKMLKWILRLNMIDCTKKLRTACEVNHQQFNFNFPKHIDSYEDVLLQTLIKTETFDDDQITFENDVFKFMFEQGMVIVVIDGYDEIGAKYRKIVSSWIQRLINKTRNQVWISSRIDFKVEIEEKFKISGFSLHQLNSGEQQSILFKIWQKKWFKKMNRDEEYNMSFYATKLLFKFNDIIRDSREYTGNPLHIIMLSDIFWKNDDEGEKTWLGCYEYVTSEGKADANISVKLKNLFELYDTFVRKKIEEFYFDDKNIYSSIQDSVKAERDKNYDKSHQMCCILGMVAMTDENEYERLLEEKEKRMLEEWRNSSVRENMGIISTAPNDKDPIFVYYIYAEYFAAYYLTNKLASTSEKNTIVLDTISKILQNDVVVFSYCVKHLLSQKLKTDFAFQNEINFYIFNNNLNSNALIKWLMDEKNMIEKFPKKDILGKTYLHYAVLSENPQSVVYVILHTYNLIIKHTVNNDFDNALFLLSEYLNVPDNTGKTALTYAKNGIFDILKDIRDRGLRKSAPDSYDGNLIKLLTEMSQHDYDLMRIDSSFIQMIFCNISFSSILYIHMNAGKDLLQNFHNSSILENLEFFDYLCTAEDVTNKNKLKIAKDFCKKYGVKDTAVTKMLIAAVENDCFDVFDFFRTVLEKENQPIPVVERFFTACFANNFPFVDIFLKQYFEEIEEYFPLSMKSLKNVSNLKIIEYIIKNTKPNLSELIRHKWYDETVMETMGSDFIIRIIEYFLDTEADLSVFNEFSEQVWKYVFKKEDDILIQRLLKNNTLEIPEKQRDRIKIINSYYFDKNYNINDKNDGESRMLKALYSRDEILLTFLLKRGSDVSGTLENGKTLLHIACERDDTKYIKMLLGFGAAFDALDYEKKKPIACLPPNFCYSSSRRTLQQLAFAFKNLKENDFNEKLENDKHYYTDEYSGDNKSEYLHLYATNKEKETLWHVAIAGDNLNELYIQKTEADNEDTDVINNKDNNGNTPLHLAVAAKKIVYVKTLLKMGAAYNVKNNEKNTPKDLAENGSEIQTLLNKIHILFHNTEYNNIDEWKECVKSLKIQEENSSDERTDMITDTDVSRFFINSSCLEVLRNVNGKNLIHKAAQNPDLNVITSLLKLRYKDDIKRQKDVLSKKEYQSLLLRLIKENKLNISKVLMQEGVPFNNAEFKLKRKYYNNQCADEFDKIREIFDHVYKENFDAVKYKMENETFEINVTHVMDYKGKTISDYAQHTTNYEFMVFLLNRGVKIENLRVVKNKKMKQVILSRSLLNNKKSLNKKSTKQRFIIMFAVIILAAIILQFMINYWYGKF